MISSFGCDIFGGNSMLMYLYAFKNYMYKSVCQISRNRNFFLNVFASEHLLTFKTV